MRKKEETQFQIDLFWKLSRKELDYKDLFVYAVEFSRNEEKVNWAEMKELKAKGMRRGISDLHVMGGGKMLFIELKSAKGTQSKFQKFFESKCVGNGFEYWVIRVGEDVDEVVRRVISHLYG